MGTPDTKRPAGHCDSDDAWTEFERQYRGQPRSYGHLSDFALANAVFMADRNDLDLIVYQTAAKERIRWLSLRLAETVEALKHTTELLASANRSTDRPSEHVSRRVREARAAIQSATGEAR